MNKNFILVLGFQPKEKASDIYIKKYKEGCFIEVIKNYINQLKNKDSR